MLYWNNKYRQVNATMNNKQLSYFVKNRWVGLSGLLLLTSLHTAYAQTVCVYDLNGSSGENYALMKDYVLAARKWNVDLVLQAYNNEEKAVQDFKNKSCDALVASSFSTRQFNNFTGTFNAIGAVPSLQLAQDALLLMNNPTFAKDMVEGSYEVAGLIPLGSAYFVMKDRNINTLEKMEGKRIGVLKIDPVQRRMAQKVGTQPVEMTIDTAGQKFRDNEIDILPCPTFGFVPFEVYRSMGTKGGVARFPLSFITLNLILRQNRFPEDFGVKSRQWFVQQTPRLMNKVARYEQAVPSKVWFDIPEEDQLGYMRLLRQMRVEFINNKTYNLKMINLLKRLRCTQAPSSFECNISD